MSSTYGENLKLSIFGQSHGPAVGMTLDGVPAGLPVDLEALQIFLGRRAPGQGEHTTARKEADQPQFLAGLLDGFTCGAPIAATIRNGNTRSHDYDNLRDCPRPGHADYTAQVKYGGFQDTSGGGHFSGRLTAPLCIAGGLCRQWLGLNGVEIHARIAAIGGIQDAPLDPVHPDLSNTDPNFPVLDTQAGQAMRDKIAAAKLDGNSLGGIIECAVTGLPAGLGEPMFGGVESKLSQILYGIPAVKGVEFGAGFAAADMTGRENNDPFTYEGGRVVTTTNNAGGILGGITNGMPLIFRVAVKPTPSIATAQQSISLSRQCPGQLIVRGRHDPCIVPRAVPVVEAAAAIALYDLTLGNTQCTRRK